MQTLKLQLIRFWGAIKLHPRRLGWMSLLFVMAFAVVGYLMGVAPVAAWVVDAVWTGIVYAISLVCRIIASLCFSNLVPLFLGYLIEYASYNSYLTVRAITIGWVTVRDLGNIFLVVTLLIIAIATIVGVESYEWKKMLTKFVMAAILVNFSRQICVFIIDAAQVVTMTFANGVASAISGNIMTAFNLDSIWSTPIDPDNPTGVTSSTDQLTTNIMTMAMAIILTVTLAVYCLIFLARMVTLWILITLSPMAFFLSVLPQTQKYASQWWTEFVNNVIMGPIIMFFFWLSLVTISSGNISTSVSTGSKFPVSSDRIGTPTAGLTGFLSWDKISSFIIGIGMLLAGIKVGQQIGGAGASMMQSGAGFAKKAMMTASGASAAIWAGKGIQKGATAAGKWGLMKAPVVGGDAWVRRGQDIAARASGGWAKVTRARVVKAGQIQEQLKVNEKGEYVDKNGQVQKGAGAWYARQKARVLGAVVAPPMMKDKLIKDKQETAEAINKQAERLMSTSSTAGGMEKQKQEAQLRKIEAEGLKIKGAKESKMDRLMRGEGVGLTVEENKAILEQMNTVAFGLTGGGMLTGALQKREQTGFKSAVESEIHKGVVETSDQRKTAEQKEGMLDANKDKVQAIEATNEKIKESIAEIKRLEEIISDKSLSPVTIDFAMQELADRKTKLAEDQESYQQQQRVGGLGVDLGVVAGNKALVESLQLARQRAESIRVAQKKDELFAEKNEGLSGGYLDQEKNKQIKEDQERLAAGGFDKNMAKIKLLAENLGKQERSGSPDAASIANMESNLSKLIMFGQAQGAEWGNNAINAAITGRGGQGAHRLDVDHSDPSSLPYQSLAGVLYAMGKKISLNPVDSKQTKGEVMAAVRSMSPEEKEQFMLANTKMANDGDSELAGSLRYKPTGRGNAEVDVVDMNDKDDQAYHDGKKKYADGLVAARLADVTGAFDRMNNQLRVFSKQALENYAKLAAGCTDGNYDRIPKATIKALADAMKNAITDGTKYEAAAIAKVLKENVKSVKLQNALASQGVHYEK